MATNSPIASLPRPELGDPPNGPGAFVNLTNALDYITIPRFVSATARNAAIASPTDGQHAWLTNTRSLTVYDSGIGDWVSYNRQSSTNSGLVVASGFTLSGGSFTGQRLNGICSVSAVLPVTAAISQSGGNISPDKLMCTLPAAYRPPETRVVGFDTGAQFGTAVITSNGQVTLRTLNADISGGSTWNIRFSDTFIQ